MKKYLCPNCGTDTTGKNKCLKCNYAGEVQPFIVIETMPSHYQMFSNGKELKYANKR